MNPVRWLQRLGLYQAAKTFNRALAAVSPAQRRRRRAMLDFYRGFVRPGDLCFDVGANEGQRTALFLELGCRVVAVEPQASCQRRLQKRFGREPRVVLRAQALGAAPGWAEMQVSDADMISSLSPEWIERVRASGRFADYAWNRRARVAVTTLDRLIAEYGTPAFCKVDVEGFEDHVFAGLSRPLRAVSFEFTPEYLQAALRSAERLAGLGSVRFNYSLGESMRLELAEWVGGADLARRLETLPDASVFGDVYAKFE